MKSHAFVAALAAFAIDAAALGAARKEPLPSRTISISVLVNDLGMTVYSFSADKGGVSACYDRCATLWPPVVAPEGALFAPWSAVARRDGSRQLAYDGKPLYTWVRDQKPGDTSGQQLEGFDGEWHFVCPTPAP